MSEIYYCCGRARHIKLTADDDIMFPQEVALVLKELLEINSFVSVQGEYLFIWDEDCEWMKILIDLGKEKSRPFNVKSFLIAGSEETIQGVFITEVRLKDLSGLSSRKIQRIIQEESFNFSNECMGIIDKWRATVLCGTHMHF